jgi:Flp pilus assembly protein TadG
MSRRPLSRNHARGAAFLELAILIPLLLVIGLGAMEFARTLQTYEAVSSVSREAARVGMKNCSASATTTAAQNCLANVVADVQSFADVMLPGTTIVLSMYEKINPSPHSQLVASVHTASYVPPVFPLPDLRASRYNASSVGSNMTLTSYRTRLVISEVFYQQRSIAPRLYIPTFNPGLVYETTIF